MCLVEKMATTKPLTPRGKVKKDHEVAMVQLLIDTLNHRHGASYTVFAEPEPPEAIIVSAGKASWVEVVGAYWNQAYATDLHSYAAVGQPHKPIGPGPYTSMDNVFAKQFARVAKSKLEKTTYQPAYDALGQGYLVVSIHFPFFDRATLQSMREEWNKLTLADRGYFKSIYLAHAGQLSLWRR